MFAGRLQYTSKLRLLSRYEPETIAYAATHTMTDAEKAALDLEIKGIKSGTPLTLSSLTLNLSLDGKFITRASVDLNRYSGISGVQFSVAATGTPATTAVFSGAITAGTGETFGSDLLANIDFTSGWNASTATINDSNTFTLTAASGGVARTITAGALYYAQLLTNETAGTTNIRGQSAIPVFNTDGGSAKYVTSVNTGLYMYNTAGGIGAVIDFVSGIFIPVLTPDTTGILSAALTNGGINANSATYVVTVSKP